MTRVTGEFGITRPAEFVDVHIERDNLLFVDPSAIRAAARRNDPYGLSADAALTHFFDDILSKLKSSSTADHAEGEEKLQHFAELSGTRLGMSRRGTNGHGAAKELGSRMWSELYSNPLCQHAIATLKYVEDIPVFVEGIDRDITSDITARIILETLERFTADMMAQHPEFESVRATSILQTTYWDRTTSRWDQKDIKLPTADAKPLILVPKAFVNYKIQMSYGQYYQVPLLDHIQWENTVQVPRGKNVVTRPRYLKKTLRTMPNTQPSRRTNIEQTARIFNQDGTDLLGIYRAAQQGAFSPLSDGDLDERLDKEP